MSLQYGPHIVWEQFYDSCAKRCNLGYLKIFQTLIIGVCKIVVFMTNFGCWSGWELMCFIMLKATFLICCLTFHFQEFQSLAVGKQI